MIYNGMKFMHAPLPMLISDYRGKMPDFDHVPNAAMDFLKYPSAWGAASPPPVLASSLEGMVQARVMERLQDAVGWRIPQAKTKSGSKPSALRFSTPSKCSSTFSKGGHRPCFSGRMGTQNLRP